MPNLMEYARLVDHLTRAQFTARYPHPFLLRKIDANEEAPTWSFVTRAVADASGQPTEAAPPEAPDAKALPEAVARYEALPIVKSLQNPWPDRITVGRARNNDIVISRASISKVHGHLLPQSDGQMMIADMGSANGTKVEGRVVKGEPDLLRPGDRVELGDVAVRFVDAGGLYDFIAKLLSGHTFLEV